jgi:PAS domain S-box-containing protein
MKRDSNRLHFLLIVFYAIFLAAIVAIGYFFFPKLVQEERFFEFLAASVSIAVIMAITLAAIIRQTIFHPLASIVDHLIKLESPAKETVAIEECHFFPTIDNLNDILGDVFRSLKKNLDELEESKEYIETLMRTVQVAIIVFNKSLKVVYINDAGRKILGISEIDATDIKITEYIDSSVLAKLFKEFQDRSTILNKELPMALKDGKTLEVGISLSPLHNAASEHMGYIAVFADITQRKKAEANLRNQINFSRQIFKAIPDMVLIVDKKLKIMFVNRKAEEVIGQWTPDVRNITNYLSQRSRAEGFGQFLKESIAMGRDVKKINVLNPFVEGENYVDLAIEPVKTQNNILGALILVHDITEWRSLTRQIQNLQGFTVKLIETSPLGFISIDESFKINIWNQSAQAMFGIPIQQAQGNILFDVCPQLRQYRGAIRNAIESDAPIHMAEQVISFDRDVYKIVNLRFYQVKNESLSIVINVEDVTEVKELEDSLLQAQKMEALGMLTSGIIHDFNNVLSGILGYASLLDKSVGENPELKRCTRNILVSSDRASSMIRQILDFAKKRGSLSEHVDINELIRETLSFLGLSLKNISLQMELSSSPMFINVSRAKISQVLINLLINARDALKETQKPEITIESEVREISRHPSLVPGKYGSIQISDNGSGIKKDHLQKIFEPFFTTRKKDNGTGIGLATVKEIITDYKGSIEVESYDRKGTTFTVLLPLKDTIEKKMEIRESDNKSLEVKGIALLVDDEVVVRQIAADMLKKLSIDCIAAANGEEGVEMFQRNKSDISFVILDVEMPGMKGSTVYDALKSMEPNLKILITSGYSQDYIESQLFKRKLDHFIPKPFQVNQLQEKLFHLLNH